MHGLINVAVGAVLVVGVIVLANLIRRRGSWGYDDDTSIPPGVDPDAPYGVGTGDDGSIDP